MIPKKFNFTKTIEVLKASYKKDTRMSNQIGLGNTLESISNDPADYVVMDPWWEENYGVMGLKFGHMVQVAGKSDCGKTTISLRAIKKAQEQGYMVIYVETEGKTGPEDLIAAGIDPDQVICVHSKIAEEAYDLGLKAWDQAFIDYPDAKLLFVYDSFGNTVSMRDSAIDMTQQSAMVGGQAKTNRLGLNAMQAKMITDPVAVLLINRTYDNMGSPGKTNAGGDAINFFSMLTIQAQRKGWYERTIDGVKVRAGADVVWTVFKNHYAKAAKLADGKPRFFPSKVTYRISADGMVPLETSSAE